MRISPQVTPSWRTNPEASPHFLRPESGTKTTAETTSPCRFMRWTRAVARCGTSRAPPSGSPTAASPAPPHCPPTHLPLAHCRSSVQPCWVARIPGPQRRPTSTVSRHTLDRQSRGCPQGSSGSSGTFLMQRCSSHRPLWHSTAFSHGSLMVRSFFGSLHPVTGIAARTRIRPGPPTSQSVPWVHGTTATSPTGGSTPLKGTGPYRTARWKRSMSKHSAINS